MLLLFLSVVVRRLVSEKKSGEQGAKACSSGSFWRCSSDTSGVLESGMILQGLVWRRTWRRCCVKRGEYNIGRRQHVSKEYATISYNRMMCWHERSMDNQGNWDVCFGREGDWTAYLSFFFFLPESYLFLLTATIVVPTCYCLAKTTTITVMLFISAAAVLGFARRVSSFLPDSSEVGRRLGTSMHCKIPPPDQRSCFVTTSKMASDILYRSGHDVIYTFISLLISSS